ncbi:MAG: pitrilysin family protein [bacterium]|nr:pitrilysin family protein [bacterium]
MRLLAAAMLVSLLASCGPTAGAAVISRPAGASRHLLENGLTVIVKPNPASDLVVVEALVRAGSRLEESAQSGVTFFVRSMLVRGTHRRSADQIAQTIEGIGGLLGGGTGADFTSLYTVTPGRQLELGMELVADLLTNARFDHRDVETQRGVSLSRIRQNSDQPLQRAVDLLGAALYPLHPYAQPIMGTPETVGALTREQLVEFYQTHFTAPNTVLVVAGNTTVAQALEKAQRAFSGLRAGPPPRRIRWLRVVERALVPPLASPQEVRETRPTAAAWIAMGYLGVPAGHRDFAALRVLNAILGEGMSSRLFTEIRDRRGLAYQVGSTFLVRAGPGHIRLSAGTDPSTLSVVTAAMLREVERLRTEAPASDELERAKRGIIGRHALAREELEAQAFYLGWYEILGVGFVYDERFPEEIGRVTAAEVLRAAQKYLAVPALAVVAPPEAR